MGKKSNKQAGAFHKAQSERTNIIDALNKCASLSDVEKLAKRFSNLLKAEKQRTQLKSDYHIGEINKLNSGINQLIAEKKEQFTPVIVPPTPVEKEKPVELIKVVDATRVAQLAEVKRQLDRLSDKRAEFAGKIHALLQQDPVDIQKVQEYTDASNAIDMIHVHMTELYDQYTYGDINLDEFKAETKGHLREDNEHVQTLNTHRGVKEILLNILAAIGLNIFYGIAALVKGSPLVFKVPTDSANRLNTLNESIERATAAPFSA